MHRFRRGGDGDGSSLLQALSSVSRTPAKNDSVTASACLKLEAPLSYTANEEKGIPLKGP